MSIHEFRLSLAGLTRTQGAMKEFSFTAGLDDEMTTGLILLPRGRDIHVEGSLECVGDGVLVSATASTTVDAECSRCLTPFRAPVEVEIQELFVYPEHGVEYEDEDVSLIHDETIDLCDAVRDAIILDQPQIPLCTPGCRGLCPRCGADLNTDPDHSHDDAIDSRWLSLTGWGKMS